MLQACRTDHPAHHGGRARPRGAAAGCLEEDRMSAEPTRYLGAAEVAELFGVKPGTVETWRGRYPDFPAPDAYIGRVAGWLPSRMAELRKWEASRPGQGAGGGRPVKRTP